MTTAILQGPTATPVTAGPTHDVPGVTRPMTYEEYLATPEELTRYDILDGIKAYRLYGEDQVTNPTRLHQRIQGRISYSFYDFETTAHQGQNIPPPCDVLISAVPLRTRQPDALFISNERLALNPPEDNPAPLSPAPELVVEIVSPSDRPSVVAAKIADYKAAGVVEVWLVSSRTATVEVVRISDDEIETVATYERGQSVQSLTFPGLAVAVSSLFAA